MNPSPSPKIQAAHVDVFKQAEVHSFTARDAEFNHERMRDIEVVLRSLADGSAVLVPREEIETAVREAVVATHRATDARHRIEASRFDLLAKKINAWLNTAEAGKENG